ncbi:alpha/beta-hydrolase [Macrolepiota fuliginosa MF-IS2]|uniref:Alpha/beta-hydrolase n=1 Tax=Macrolepiota fuliginosa MF-IS2 TaxID=1400762 RepID=A0A9P6C5Q1_9AGAR|nr:alpha/beta-hydrolase [Macrolepiota fuliginosa MF-IS2]
MSAETPFKIAVPDEEIALLKKKLELTRFPDELEDAGRNYGVPLKDIQRLVAYWKDGYDWKKHEAQLNEELPQFMRDIEVEGFGTLNVHYVHKKSSLPSATPLLFVHGWPGSFLEVRKILPLLAEGSPEHPSFHVVAVGLPGYGFSEAPIKKGFAIAQYAEISHKLMLALGYNEYVTQGGDWGAAITRRIGVDYGPKHNKAWHTNMPVAAPPHPWKRPKLFLQHLVTRLTPAEKAGLERTQWIQKEGQGYFAEQSTQPQTLGYSLADSPAGLLGWIYEKLVNWTDDYPWTDDEVLTWISIYWFSRPGPAASVRIYYEFVKSGGRAFHNPPPVGVPTGYSYFPKEIIVLPRYWCKAPNVVFESEHKRGGHFAAYECPEALVTDLRKMFGKGGPGFGLVTVNQGST